MAYTNLINDIKAVIKNNGNQEITGNVLQGALLEMINALGANYQYAGVADTSTTITTTEANVFYLLTEAGTYSNMSSSIVHTSGIGIALWNGTAWSYQNVPYITDATPTEGSTNPVQSGGVYPLSQSVNAMSSSTFVEPKNWFNESELEIGCYYSGSGTSTSHGDRKYTASSYNSSGLIPVKEGETYIFSYGSQSYYIRSIRFLSLYNSSGMFIETKSNISSPYTIPSGVHYVRISADANNFKANNNVMYYYGTRTATYSAYFPPYYRYDAVKDKFQFGEDFCRFNYTGSVASQENKNISCGNISKGFTLTAQINSSLSDVVIGLNYNTINGRWYRITSTDLVILNNSGTIGTYQHGLNITDKTTFVLSKETNGTSARIKLLDNDGGLFEKSDDVRIITAKAFVLNQGADSVDVSLSFFARHICANIWIFGDSYLSYNDPARWLYYMINWGFDNFLLNAQGGENSAQNLTDFQNLLLTGARPSYVVWCSGMNDGADETTYNMPSFKYSDNTNKMLELCEQYGITPILATIPTIPSASHALLNDWVRNSRHRYIDFAAAVEETGTTYWKNHGEENAMLSSDNVHPTTYGAKALAAQAMADFPEITILQG